MVEVLGVFDGGLRCARWWSEAAHLALGLLLLEALELILLLGPLFAPFVNVLLQLLVQVRPLLVLTLEHKTRALVEYKLC